MRRLAPICVILAASLWGCLGFFVRQLSAYGFTSMEIVVIRMAGAFLCLFGFLLIYNCALLKIRLKDIWCFVGTGIVSITFFNYCYFTTIQMASLAVASILLYTAPAVVTVFGILLFKESISAPKLIALLLAFAGCVLVTGVLSEAGASLPLKAVLLGLGSGFGYAMYSVFGNLAIKKGYKSVTISAYTFLFGFLSSAGLAGRGGLIRKIAMHPDCAGAALALVLFGTVAAYVLYTAGLSGMETGKASILASIEPVVATLIGFVIYKETLDKLTALGVFFVLLSSALCVMGTKPDSSETI